MNIEYEITKIKNQLQNLQDIVLQISRNSVPTTSKVDDTANQVKAITPYTETKQGYIGDTQIIFNDVPSGNVSVFGLNSYSITRELGDLIIAFPALNEVTDITISVIES